MLRKQQTENEKPQTKHGPIVLEDYDVSQVLLDSCEKKLPAMLVLPDLGTSYRCEMTAATHDTLTLTLWEDRPSELRALTACFVTFCIKGRGLMGVTAVQEMRESGAAPGRDMLVDVPDRLLSVDIRRWFRLPTTGAEGLRASAILPKDRLAHVRCCDISLGGLQIEFIDPPIPDLEAGNKLVTMLEYQSYRLEIPGEVRKRNGSRYGLAVAAAVRDTRPYRMLVTELERDWLQRRAFLEKEAQDRRDGQTGQ